MNGYDHGFLGSMFTVTSHSINYFLFILFLFNPGHSITLLNLFGHYDHYFINGYTMVFLPNGTTSLASSFGSRSLDLEILNQRK